MNEDTLISLEELERNIEIAFNEVIGQWIDELLAEENYED